jgi:hypothetical protein
LNAGFEARATPTAEFKIVIKFFFILHNELQTSSQNSKIGLRSIHVVSEASALFPSLNTTTGSFIIPEDQQRVKRL